MATSISKSFESMLRQEGLATDAELEKARERINQGAVSFLDVLVKEIRVPEEAIASALSKKLKLPRARVASVLLDEEVLNRVPERLARQHLCLPLAIEGRRLVVALADPTDYRAIQDIEFASGLTVRPMVATLSEIDDGIQERYGAENQIGQFLANVPEADIRIVSEDTTDQPLDVADSLVAAEVAPVIKMVNLIIHDAIKASASDVHLEPALHDLQVRMRVDGVLRDYTRVPKWLQGPLVSRLKILAKLDIAERRVPQDGRVNVIMQGRSIDLRVSTLPTQFGEKIVLRILGNVSALKIDGLGLSPAQAAVLVAAAEQPQGTILVTGPTGSGKTTTLYALLAHHQKPEVNIVTVEDPIEYQLAGVNQVQVNPKAGLTFASALRSILRQDPDVILVGETRDRETAEIACQAAMTGHMVLTTLHTNSAIGAVARMFDMGIESSILAASLTLVIAQRLVRRVCTECREEYEPGDEIRNRVGLSANGVPVYHGRGCPACGGTGYSGRIAVYEMFRPTNTIRKLINDRASESELRYTARQSGMKLLREDALEKIKAGITSPEEVIRVVQADENEIPCPGCQAMIEVDFTACPFCARVLRSNCSSCGQPLRTEWKVCPYCNTNAGSKPSPDAADTVLAGDSEKGSLTIGDRRSTSGGRRRDDVPRPAEDADRRASDADRRARGADRRAAPRDAAPPFEELVHQAERSYAEARAAAAQPASPAGDAGVREAGFGVPPDGMPDGMTEIEIERPIDRVSPPVAPAFPPDVEPHSTAAPEADTAASAADDIHVVDVPAQPAAFAPEEQRPIRILIVDDDADVRMIVAATLRKLPVPVELVEAEDGKVAVEKALASTPDLVVLDIMMPRMDGFDTCRALREHVRTAFVPILMLTASADQSSRTKGYLIGTDDYMSKPFLPLDLKMRVTRLLRRTYGI
jgi:type IV pilus assembly protein PilB